MEGLNGIAIDSHRFVDVVLPTTLWPRYGIVPVSYTHLDVYKRQQYIINDAQIRYLFVGEQFQYDAAFKQITYLCIVDDILCLGR